MSEQVKQIVLQFHIKKLYATLNCKNLKLNKTKKYQKSWKTLALGHLKNGCNFHPKSIT